MSWHTVITIFNLSSSQQIFPILWKQAAVVFKEGKAALENNYGSISILNTFSEIFQIIIHGHVSHHLKSKSKPCQHGFIKSKSAFANLVAYLDLIILLVHSQHHVDDYFFFLSNALVLVPHALLLHELDDFGLSCAYITWFHSYLRYRLSHVCYRGTLSKLYEVLSSVPQGSVLGTTSLQCFHN